MPRVLCHARRCIRRPAHEFRLGDTRQTAARLCRHHSERLDSHHPVVLGGKQCLVCGDEYDEGRLRRRIDGLQFSHDDGHCVTNVNCEEQTVHLEDFTGNREFDREVAEVCRYCPNADCPGALHADHEHACRTMRWWLQDKLDLAQAAAAKRFQHRRHQQTDEFRDWVFHRLAEANSVTSEEADRERDYDKRRDAGQFASAVAKGQDAHTAKREMEQELWIHIPASICHKIEEKRDELVDVGDYSPASTTS